MANHYVLVDGVLQKSSSATRTWVRRAARAVPRDSEEKPDAVALPTEDRRTDYEKIQDLEEGTPDVDNPPVL
jgi:hypothetical protein